ncbi:MAG: hypothetical protein ACSLE8_05665 [Rhodococcus sp. (in: high G+C Gram-positive bacteria)]
MQERGDECSPDQWKQDPMADTGVINRDNPNETMVLDGDEWAQLVDAAARFHLQIDGHEFMTRLDAGEFDDPDNGPAGLMAVLALVPGR